MSFFPLPERYCLGGSRWTRVGEEFSGEAAGGIADFSERSFGDDFPSADAGTGTEINDAIGGEHRFFIVLDDDDGIPLIAEVDEALEEAGVVAGMEADGGFVEDVDDADETAPDLAGEADVCFPSGEGGSGAVEGEVVEAAAEEKSQSPANFLDGLIGDQFSGFVEIKLMEEPVGIGDAETQRSVRPDRGGVRRDGERRGLRVSCVWIWREEELRPVRFPNGNEGLMRTLRAC